MQSRLRNGYALVICGALGVGFAWYLSALAPRAQAQAPATPRPEAAVPRVLADDDQISAQHYFYKEVAQAGPARGELIYGYKCFMCHQKNSQDAPHLTDVHKRPNLTDESLASVIKNGTARMPSF